MANRRKVVISVNVEPEVVEYLNDLQKRIDRNRSWIINTLVKRQAELEKAGNPAIRLDMTQEAIRL